MANFSTIQIRFAANLKEFSSEMQNVQRDLQKVGKEMQQVGKTLSIGLTAPIVALGFKSIKTFTDFESSLAKVQAVSGATSDEMKLLKQNAEDLGASTRFAASEVAGLQLNFSKLGLSPNEILKATGATLDLAQATGEDLAMSATVAAATLQGFGLDASETTRVTDVMAASFSSSALDLTKFQTAMATVAPVAKTAGQSIESTTGLLSVLVNAGLDASTAGTGLRNIFLDLSASGLTLDQAFDKINNSTNKNLTAMEMFGKRGATVATVLAENSNQAKEFTSQFENAEGAARKMADIMDNTLEGSFFRLQSAVESLFIAIGEQLAPVIRGIADFIASLVGRFKDLDTETKKIIIVVAALAAAIGPVLLIFGTLATTVLPAVGAAFTLLTGPIGLVIAAVAGIAYMIYKHWDTIKKEIVSLQNYFISLYNESLLIRVAVEFIALQFKSLWEVGKMVFSALWNTIKLFGQSVMNLFKSVGKLIKAALTGEFKSIPGILSDSLKKQAQIASGFMKSLAEDAKSLQTNLINNFNTALNNIQQRKPVKIPIDKEKITEDVATAVAKGMAQGGSGRKKVSGVNELDGVGLEAVSPLASFTTEMASEYDLVQDTVAKTQEQLEMLAETARGVGMEVANAFSGMTNRFIDALNLADTGFQGFVKNMAATIAELISMLLANSIANAISGATASAVATGPGAIFSQPAFIAKAVGGVVAAFAAIPKFASGGIVSGPTLGLMGEYSGARSNPEVIAPLDKLKSMLGDSGNEVSAIEVFGSISGDVINLSSARSASRRRRRS